MNKQVAIVTGAGRGIGKGIAENLIKKGYKVALADILEDVLTVGESFGDKLTAKGYQLDIRNKDQVKSFMEEVNSHFGSVNILVNVAGTCNRKAFSEMTLEDWDLDVATNMTGTFLMCQSAIYPYMKEAGFGRIVNIASVSGLTGGVGPVYEDGSGGRSGIAYAASKAGVINMTKWIAREVGKYGITCNAIAPGVIRTEMTKDAYYDFSNQPIQKWGEPQDIATAVNFLVSKESSFITGECLNVDGGSTMV